MKPLLHGFKQKCPHCGKGKLFRGWMKHHAQCSVCHFVFGHASGDLWAFWTVGDRLFVIVALVGAFILANQSSFTGAALWTLRAGLLTAVTAGLILTMPHRMGLCIALDYLVRRKTSHPEDEYPPLGTKKRREDA